MIQSFELYFFKIKRVQFFEWYQKIISLGRIRKRYNSLKCIQKKVQVFELNSNKNEFNSLSQIKKFNSLSHSKISSIIWVILKEKFSSLSHVQKKKSILWVLISKKKKRCNSLSHIFEKKNQFQSHRKKFRIFEPQFLFLKKSLWVMFKKKMFNSLSRVPKKKRFNFLSHIKKKRFNSLSHITTKFNYLSRIKKVQFFEFFVSSKIFLKKNLVFQKKKVQFFESYWQTVFNSLSHLCEKGSILCVIFKKKVSFLCVIFKSHFRKRV